MSVWDELFLEEIKDNRTTEQKVIDAISRNSYGHLCWMCNRLYDIQDVDYTTIDPHACPYAYDDWETKDNGGGYWVTKCKHYIPIDTRRIYKTWINSEDWKDIAFQKMKKAGFQCELCGTAKNLCVHHITYEHLCREEEHMEDLLCVCKTCHRKLHENDLKKCEKT